MRRTRVHCAVLTSCYPYVWTVLFGVRTHENARFDGEALYEFSSPFTSVSATTKEKGKSKCASGGKCTIYLQLTLLIQEDIIYGRFTDGVYKMQES